MSASSASSADPRGIALRCVGLVCACACVCVQVVVHTTPPPTPPIFTIADAIAAQSFLSDNQVSRILCPYLFFFLLLLLLSLSRSRSFSLFLFLRKVVALVMMLCLRLHSTSNTFPAFPPAISPRGLRRRTSHFKVPSLAPLPTHTTPLSPHSPRTRCNPTHTMYAGVCVCESDVTSPLRSLSSTWVWRDGWDERREMRLLRCALSNM